MEKYIVLEEIDLFWESDENSGITIPEGRIIIGKFNEEKNILEFDIDGIKYWQYNYSIEDKIESV